MNLSLREKFTKNLRIKLVAAFTTLLLFTVATAFAFLWEQRRHQILNFLNIEEQRINAEIELIRDSAERISASLPTGLFADPQGPYEYVDDFTLELEQHQLDFGWIIDFRSGHARPWIDGMRRIVLRESAQGIASQVANDLQQKPWPQQEEGSGRSYRFSDGENSEKIIFLEAFPIYKGTTCVGFLLVGRLFAIDSSLGESMKMQLDASAGIVSGIEVKFENRDIFRIGTVPQFMPQFVERGLNNKRLIQLRGFSQSHDLLLAGLGALLVSSTIAVLGIHLLSWWSRRAVKNLLTPLDDLVESTGKLSLGDYAARVHVPHEEELKILAEKFNFLASNLEQTMSRLADSARKEEESRRRALETEIIQLRSQLQPHFLFNSLNMIAQTLHENTETAYDMTLALADLYHAILRAADKTSHSIEEEIAIVDGYLRIQKMRFGERLHYEIPSIPFEFSLQIPCMALQNLVENSIKHGFSQSREGGYIRIFLKLSEGHKHIVIENNGAALPETVIDGTGLSNTKRRWALLHGPRAHFAIMQTAEGKIQSVLSILRHEELLS